MNPVFDAHNALKKSVQAPKGKEQQHTYSEAFHQLKLI